MASLKNLVRLSVEIENSENLITDTKQVFEKI